MNVGKIITGGTNFGFKAFGTSTFAALLIEFVGFWPSIGGGGTAPFDFNNGGGAGGPLLVDGKDGAAGGPFLAFGINKGGGGGIEAGFDADGVSLNFEKLSLSCLRTVVGGCLATCSCLRNLANNSKASSDSNVEINVLISLAIFPFCLF